MATYFPPAKNVLRIHICTLRGQRVRFAGPTHNAMPIITTLSSTVNQNMRLCVDSTVE